MESYVGTVPITEMFVGEMGIKEVYIGDTLIYQRPGGYCYIELDTSENTD